MQDLIDEAFAIVGAAVDTTGNALTIASYNIVANPGIYQEATKELKAAFPDPSEMKFISLEKLPYLVIYPSDIDIEAMLMVVDRGYQKSSSVGLAFYPIRAPLTQLVSFGVPGRLPRVFPQPGAQFNSYYVPERVRKLTGFLYMADISRLSSA